MTTIDWSTALQGVTPQQGFSPLPPATYRFRIVAGEGKTAGSGAQMVSVQLEVISGPKQGRKTFHNWVLPKDGSDKGKQSMGFFLGAMMVFGLPPEWFAQAFAGQQISKEHADYIAKALVQANVSFKATASIQTSDPSRNNFNNFVADDGVEPEPPKETAPSNLTPGAPPVPGMGTGPGGPPGLPLGGFPGSGGQNGAMPSSAPEWAQGPGQTPAYQPAAAAPPVPQPPTQGQYAPAAQAQPQGGFPGQQFPGQVDPANFPAQGQPQQQFGGPVQGFQGQPDPQGQFPQQAQPAFQAQQPMQPQGGFPGGQAAPQMPGMPTPGAQPPVPGQVPVGVPQGFPGQPGQPTY